MDSKGRILIVDDNALNRIATTLILKSEGYEIEQATSGFDALDKTKSNSYHAILMDFNMPEMDGLECTRQIRAQEIDGSRKTRIIVFSVAVNLTEAMCKNSGADQLLSKICSNEELFQAIKISE